MAPFSTSLYRTASCIISKSSDILCNPTKLFFGVWSDHMGTNLMMHMTSGPGPLDNVVLDSLGHPSCSRAMTRREARQELKSATTIDRVSMKLSSVYLSRGLIIYTQQIVAKGPSRLRFPARDPSSIWSQHSVPTQVARLEPSARFCQNNMASCIEQGHSVRGVGHPVSLEVDQPFQQCQCTLRHNNPIPPGHGHHVLSLLPCTFEEPTHSTQSCPILKQRLSCSNAMATQRNTITSQCVRGDEKEQQSDAAQGGFNIIDTSEDAQPGRALLQ